MFPSLNLGLRFVSNPYIKINFFWRKCVFIFMKNAYIRMMGYYLFLLF
jgi:hypothetical protein